LIVTTRKRSDAIEFLSASSGSVNSCLNMADGEDVEIDYDDKGREGDLAVKVICLGDSAVGKSK
jgi:hypothetical protein